MNVNELIQNLNDGDNVKANKQFKTVMADKLSAALDAKKIEIASGMVQRNEVESEEDVEPDAETVGELDNAEETEEEE